MSEEESMPGLLADDTSDDEHTIRMSQVDISPVLKRKAVLIPTGKSNSRGEQELLTGRTNSRGDAEMVYGFVDPRTALRSPTNPYVENPSYESPLTKGASIDGSYHQHNSSFSQSMEQERKSLSSARAFSSHPQSQASASYSSFQQAQVRTNVGGPLGVSDVPFTYGECMDYAFEKLKIQAQGSYETNHSKNVSVQVGNIQKKGHNLMIAENVSADMDSSTAMNIIADKLEQVLDNNGVIQSYVKFDIDMGMQYGLGSRIEFESNSCQTELQMLAAFQEKTEDKKDHDKEVADEEKQARTAEWVKKAAEERLNDEDCRNMSTTEFNAYFKDKLSELHGFVDYGLEIQVEHCDRVIERTLHKMAKVRKNLTVCQIMSQLLDAYVYVIQAITAEVISAMKNHKSIILEASTQTTHVFSGRSSTNPHHEARLSCIYQSLTKGREVHVARAISQFMDLAGSVSPGALAKEPLKPFNNIMAFMQLLQQSGAIKYFLNIDTIAMCLLLCSYREAPLPVTTGIFNIVNETEKKRKLLPNSPIGEFEMTNAVKEFLKMQTTVQEFRTNRYAGKVVVDLSNEPPFVPKRPVVFPNRRNESGYVAQARTSPKLENTERHIHEAPVTRMAGINYFLGSNRTVYVAVPTAVDVCHKCCNESAPKEWHPTRCYTKQCFRCKLYGHSQNHCRQKVKV